MKNESFGELILTTKTNLNGMLKCEWINFKKYAEVHFKDLKITHLVHSWNGWLMEIILRKNNGAYLEFQNFITKDNLIEFVKNNGYDAFVDKIESNKNIQKDDEDNNNDDDLNCEFQLNIEI